MSAGADTISAKSMRECAVMDGIGAQNVVTVTHRHLVLQLFLRAVHLPCGAVDVDNEHLHWHTRTEQHETTNMSHTHKQQREEQRNAAHLWKLVHLVAFRRSPLLLARLAEVCLRALQNLYNPRVS